MKIHPVFHNSLLKPYHETQQHSPNHERPTPEIVNGEEGHYEIESILMARPTRNRKSTQYLVRWKGYPKSENSWLPEKELSHAQELLTEFKQRTSVQALQAQQKPKEGILSWTQSTTSSFQSSKSKVPQVNQVIRPARDPEKLETRAQVSGDQIPCDQTRSKSPDTPRDLSRVITRDKSRDPIHFGRARNPLISRWQMVGTVNNQRTHVTPVIG
jgi:hypothetical protein